MLVSQALLTNSSGFIRFSHPNLSPQRIQRHSSSFMFSGDSCLHGSVRYYYKHVGLSSTVSVCLARQGHTFHEHLPEEEPLWLSLVKDIVWSTRSLFSFMAEQPSQLKFIEWPSFINTLKTATLSLCLVAVFIVALSSVDSALCYILALVLRKAP
ncbi:unnamed protein product [Cochlearia groenlandica]